MLTNYLPLLINGVGVTIQVAGCALLLGLILGLIGAVGESTSKRWLRYIFVGFHSIIRGVPELVILFFIYFGSSALLNHVFHRSVPVSAFIAGVIALGLIFGGYASQTFRGAFLAISYGQVEAAKALGLNRRQTFWFIQLPQAWRHALPGLGNLWLVLLKDTALISLIGLSDLMLRAQTAAISTAKPFTFYFTAAIIYLILTSISQVVLTYLDKRATRYL